METHFNDYLRQWFKERPGVNVRWVERSAGLTRGTLSLFLLDERGFPRKHRKAIVKVLIPLGFTN